MRKMAYFTEAMRTCRNQEKEKAVKTLKNFLKNTSFEELETITRESSRGAEIMALKSNPALIEPFIKAEEADNSVPFGEWISNFSRSWNLLN